MLQEATRRLHYLVVILCGAVIVCGFPPYAAAVYHGPGRSRKRLLPLLLRYRLQALVGSWRCRRVERAIAQPFMPDGIARLHSQSFSCSCREEFRESLPVLSSLLVSFSAGLTRTFCILQFPCVFAECKRNPPPSSSGLTGNSMHSFVGFVLGERLDKYMPVNGDNGLTVLMLYDQRPLVVDNEITPCLHRNSTL